VLITGKLWRVLGGFAPFLLSRQQDRSFSRST